MKILGGIDVVVGLILIFGSSVDFPTRFLWIMGVILLAKSSLGFWQDFGSWVDVLGGVMFFLMILIHIPIFFSLIIGILLVQKGAVSFI